MTTLPNLRRLLIDCSYVDFSRQPTGIPRVVLKYIEVGYTWGAQTGIEVVPVIPTADGLFVCRPVPGRLAPANIIAAAAAEAQVPPTQQVQAIAALLGLLGASDPLLALTTTQPEPEVPLGGPITRTVRIKPGPHDLLFCPAYWHDVPPERYRGYSALGVKIVILVHDVLPIMLPRFYDAPWCYDFRRNVLAAFSYAAAFCTVSNLTREALAELGQSERMSKLPMMTTYNGFEPLLEENAVEPRHFPEKMSARTIEGLGRYYLMVGSLEPKKGHLPVIQCFEAMWGAGLTSNLVVIGRPGWMSDAVVAAVENSRFYNSRLFWFSGLDDSELGRMYNGARALVFASLSEGFGIPMVEAAAHGCPVIAYDTPIVREILAGRAQLFSGAREFVARITEMERDGLHANAVLWARDTAWPSWEQYTPRVYDALRAFFDGAAQLPEVIPKNLPAQAAA